MATFFSNAKINNWGGVTDILGNLTGNVTRSGNTVTLSNIVLSWWFASTSGVWGTDSMTFTVNGQTSGNITIGQGATSGSIGVPNSSFGVSTTQTSASIGWSCSNGGLSGSFTVSFPSGATAPTGLATQVTARTWNSATMKTSVSSWGTGAGPNRLVIHLSPTYNNDTYMRQAEASYSPFTATINNSTSTGTHQAFTMKGCHTLYPWIYAYNGTIEAKTWGSAFYLPPAPLQSITAGTQGYSGTNVTVPITITGGNSTNNNNVTVTTQYQYKVGSGSLSSWTSAGTGTPWTAKSVTLSVASNSSLSLIHI